MARKHTLICPASDVSVNSDGYANFNQTRNIAVFNPNVLDGVHIWREWIFRDKLFISEAFYKAVKFQGMKFLPTWVGEIVIEK